MNSRKIKILKSLSVILILPVLALAFFIFPVEAQALSDGAQKALDGLKKAAGKAFQGNDQGLTSEEGIITSIPVAIGTVVGAGLALIGLVFLILMIYGGLMWMTARGNEQQVGKAKQLILAAIIGLFIVLSAYAITAYIGYSLI